MIQNKTIALIAHDRRKADMVEWVEYNAYILLNNQIVATGTTGLYCNKGTSASCVFTAVTQA